MTQCDHTYQFAGVVYSANDRPMAGSGAHERIYEDKFFCTKCLETVYRNKRFKGNTYSTPIEGSFPK